MLRTIAPTNVINATTITATTSVTTPIVQALNSAGGTLKNSGGTNQLQWGLGGGNNLSLEVATNINPANAAVAISPTGTGTVTINPATLSSMNNVTVGATTAAEGTFTNLAYTGTLTGGTGIVNLGSGQVYKDASGNVGIGTSTPNAKLDIAGSAQLKSSNILYFNNSNNTNQYFWQNIGPTGANNATLTLTKTNTGEVLRVAADGNLLVRTTTSRARISVDTNSGIARSVNILTGASTMDQFLFNGTATGSITTDGVTTAYNTTSDYRLKKDVKPMVGALEKVAALKPVTYTWKSNGNASQGFIAHELQAVIRECVTGEKDAVNKDGEPEYQGIDTSYLIATLTAAIQEQQALIQSIADRLTALEAM